MAAAKNYKQFSLKVICSRKKFKTRSIKSLKVEGSENAGKAKKLTRPQFQMAAETKEQKLCSRLGGKNCCREHMSMIVRDLDHCYNSLIVTETIFGRKFGWIELVG